MFKSASLPRRRFLPTFKLKVVLDALSNTTSKAAIGRKYDINANQVTNWIREYREEADWVQEAKSSDLLPIVIGNSVDQKPRNDAGVECLSEHPSGSHLTIRFRAGHELSLSAPTGSQLLQILESLA